MSQRAEQVAQNDQKILDALLEEYEHMGKAFITATEFYLWKLLRKDLGKSLEQCRQIFLFSLESLARNVNNQ